MDIQPMQPATQPVNNRDNELVPPSEAYTYKDQVCEIVETLTLDVDPRKNRTKQSILKNRFYIDNKYYLLILIY